MTRTALALALALFTAGCAQQAARATRDPAPLEPALQLIESRFITPMPRSEIEAETLRALLTKLDPYSYYYDAKEWAAYRERLTGGYSGIGVLLDMDDTRRLPRVDGLMLHSNAGAAG